MDQILPIFIFTNIENHQDSTGYVQSALFSEQFKLYRKRNQVKPDVTILGLKHPFSYNEDDDDCILDIYVCRAEMLNEAEKA